MTSRALILLGLLSVVRPVVASDDYTLGPDSQPQPGVPKGRVLGPSSGRAPSSQARSASTGSTFPPSTT